MFAACGIQQHEVVDTDWVQAEQGFGVAQRRQVAHTAEAQQATLEQSLDNCAPEPTNQSAKLSTFIEQLITLHRELNTPAADWDHCQLELERLQKAYSQLIDYYIHV